MEAIEFGPSYKKELEIRLKYYHYYGIRVFQLTISNEVRLYLFHNFNYSWNES